MSCAMSAIGGRICMHVCSCLCRDVAYVEEDEDTREVPVRRKGVVMGDDRGHEAGFTHVNTSRASALALRRVSKSNHVSQNIVR